MATSMRPRKPTTKAKRDSAVGTTVVVVARCTFDDLPVRVFAGSTARRDAMDWTTKLARSSQAADETVKALADRIGWELDAFGVFFFSVIVHVGGVPTEKLDDIYVVQPMEVKR